MMGAMKRQFTARLFGAVKSAPSTPPPKPARSAAAIAMAVEPAPKRGPEPTQQGRLFD
jgi:hypothetical protein